MAAWDMRQQRMQVTIFKLCFCVVFQFLEQDRDKRGGKGREGKSLAVIVKSDVFGWLHCDV